MSVQELAANPYRIAVRDDVLDHILRRVREFDWNGVPDAGIGAGIGTQNLRKLIEYWLNEFDWRKEERALNCLPHFTAAIDGANVHFIHLPSRNPAAFPLVLTHGWPGSFVEFVHIAERLADPQAFGDSDAPAFHVIIPSLPGYGFSDRPAAPIGPRRIAATFHRLVTDVLGYPRYVAQGGDWGAAVSSWLAADNPEHCLGAHLNQILLRGVSWTADTEEELASEAAMQQRFMQDGAYALLQMTKPQSIAYALADSPVGTAAWIADKFEAWHFKAEDDKTPRSAGDRFGMDRLLTNIMIYLVSGSLPTANWLYRGFAIEQMTHGDPIRIDTPMGIAAFPDPVFSPPPRSLVEKAYNVIHWTDMPRGGHFAALEEPDLLVSDLRHFVKCLPRGLTD